MLCQTASHSPHGVHRKQWWPLLSLLFVFCGNVDAQPSRKSYAPENDFVVESWDSNTGLKEHCVTSIFQTSDSYLWLSSYNGISRFDGVNFTHLSAYYRQKLTGYSVHRFYEDRQGHIWFTFLELEPLFVYYRDRDTMLRIDAGPAALKISSINERWGQIMVAAENRIYKVEGGSLKVVDSLPDPEPTINGLCTVGNLMYVPTSRGLYLYTSKGLQRLPSYGHSSIFGIQAVPGSTKRLVVIDSSFFLEEGSQRTFLYRSPPGKLLRAFAVDRYSTLWICHEKGVLRVDTSGAKLLGEPEGLNPGSISHILCDKDNNIWCGYDSQGLVKLHRKLVRFYSIAKTLGGESVGPVLTLAPDCVLVSGYCEGLVTLAKGTIKKYKLPFPDRTYCIWSLLRDHQGDLWQGIYGSGVIRLTKNSWSLFRNPYSEKSNTVLSLYEDKKGIVWAGTRDGLWPMNSNGYLTTRPVLPAHDIHAIKPDRLGRLWCCTSSGLVVLQNQRPVLKFTTADGLSDNHVRDVLADQQGNYWVATYGGGLNVITNGRTVAFKNKLLDPFCSALWIYDSTLFVSSNKGLYYARLSDLLRFAHGQSDIAFFNYLGREHGLLTDEFNGGGQPAVAASGNHLYFPTISGVARFDVRSVTARKQELHELSIEHVFADGQEVRAENGIYRLPEKTTRVEINYNYPELNNPQNIYFQNMLVGKDKTWSPPQKKRSVEFVLPPGDHTIRLRVFTHVNGRVPENLVRLHLPTPLYLQSWFTYGVSVVALVLILFAFLWRLKTVRREAEKRRQADRRQAELEMKAFRNQMSPHFIFNCLNNIKFFITMNDVDSANNYVDAFGRVLRSVTEHSLANTIPLLDEIRLLKDYVKLEQMRFDYFFSFEVQQPPDELLRDLHVPYLMLQPLIENAIRHGLKPAKGPCKLILEIKLSDERLIVRVIDNGIGINNRRPAGDKHHSVALTNITERIKTLNYLENADISMTHKAMTPEEHGTTGTIVELNLPKEL